MSDPSGKLKRNIKRFFGVLLVLGVILSILVLWGWRTVRTDHAYTIKRVQELVRSQYNAKLDLSGYELEWVNPYPTLKVSMKDIRLASVLDSTAPVLRANYLQFRVDVEDWWIGAWEMEPVLLDSAWVHLRKDAEGGSNLRFAATSEQKKKKVKPWDIDFGAFPEINFNFLDFHNENLQRKKWQRAQMLRGRIGPAQNAEGKQLLNINSAVHFDGLMFKRKDGGYLMNRDGDWDLNFGISEDGLALEIQPSTLRVDSTEFLIEGSFHRADTNRIKLHIRNEGVLMTTVLPLLTYKIQRKLEEIEIDQPVSASFSLDELLHRSKKGVMQIDFAASDATVNFRQLDVERTDFKGYYSNDCDGEGSGDSENSCVVFEYVRGDLYGLIPTEAKGKIDNLRDAQLTAIGTMNISLPRLNEQLAANNKVTFKDGKANLQMAYQGPFDDIIDDPFNEEKVRMHGDVVFSDVVLDLPARAEPLPALAGYMNFDDQASQLRQLNLEWMGANVQLSGTLQNLPEFLFFDNQALESDLRLHFDHLQLGGKGKSSRVKQKKKSFDFEKARDIARKIATNVNGQIQLDIDRLSYDTILLTDIHTRFRLLSPLLYAENADSAMIQMEKLSARYMGKTSFEMALGFSQEADTKLLLDVNLPDAQVIANAFLPKGNTIKSGQVSLDIKGRIPLRNIIEPEEALKNMVYSGQLHFDEVNVELASFTWPVQTLSGKLDFDQDRLVFDDVHFHYEGAPFDLNGTIDDYRFIGQKRALADLRLGGRSVNWRNNQKQEKTGKSQASSFTPAKLFQDLDTIYQLAAGRLALTLDTVYTIKHTITPLQVAVNLRADPGNIKQHELQIDTLQLGFGGRNLITGKARISNPEQPKLDAQLNSVLNFRKLADFLPSEYIELQDGFFRMELDYQVPLYDSINAENYILGAEIDGKAEIVDGKIFYNYRDFQVDNLYSHISFNNRDLNIRDLDLSLNNNRLFADGTSADFFPFFILPDRKARIALNVASPQFDFGEFTAPHGLGKDSVAVDTSGNVLEKTGGFIDQLLSNGSLDMNADFDLVKYADFQAKEIKGIISLHPDTVRLDSVQMNLAKGAFLIDGSITDIIYHQPKIAIDAQFKESNVQQLFHQFQNFGQSALDSTNIKGYASVDVQFRSEANSNYALLPGTMHGNLEFKLFGGQLINLPGVRKISGFLSKKRQLDHIIIDTLETNSYIRGSDIYFDKFNLNSSSFTFDVEGVYSMDEEEDNTRILFGVPLSNLFRRHVSAKELKKEKRARKGLKIFIEARPKKDKMRFRWKIPLNRKPYKLPEEED